MSYCLICQSFIQTEVTWSNFLFPNKASNLCEECQKKIEQIEGDICEKCGRQMKQQGLCSDCIRWETRGECKEVLEKNRAVFQYNSFMKEIISQWKYRGDYHLIEIFKPYILEVFDQHFSKLDSNFVMIPIPLTEERLYERAFNQSEAIAKIISKKSIIPSILKRDPTKTEKQSKKSKRARLESNNPFYLETGLNKTAVIVDDIYTTGTTIYHAAKTLKLAGCPHVNSFTLIR